MKRFVMATAAVLVAGVLVAGCGGGSTATSGGGAAQAVTLKTPGMKFEPGSLEVKVGQPVKLTLENPDSQEHDLRIAGVADKEVKLKVAPGKNGTVEFTPTKEGSFDFICTIAGHKEAGMKGTIVVKK